MNDQQAFHADMLRLEQHIDSLLRAAAVRPLTADEILDLRIACGIPNRTSKPIIHSTEEPSWV